MPGTQMCIKYIIFDYIGDNMPVQICIILSSIIDQNYYKQRCVTTIVAQCTQEIFYSDIMFLNYG